MASTAPVFNAFCRMRSMSSPWPRSTVNVTTSKLYFSPIHGTITEVSKPPLYARMTFSLAMTCFTIESRKAFFVGPRTRPRYHQGMDEAAFDQSRESSMSERFHLVVSRSLVDGMMQHAQAEA